MSLTLPSPAFLFVLIYSVESMFGRQITSVQAPEALTWLRGAYHLGYQDPLPNKSPHPLAELDSLEKELKTNIGEGT
jgi:hypothetical protein